MVFFALSGGAGGRRPSVLCARGGQPLVARDGLVSIGVLRAEELDGQIDVGGAGGAQIRPARAGELGPDLLGRRSRGRLAWSTGTRRRRGRCPAARPGRSPRLRRRSSPQCCSGRSREGGRRTFAVAAPRPASFAPVRPVAAVPVSAEPHSGCPGCQRPRSPAGCPPGHRALGYWSEPPRRPPRPPARARSSS